MQHAKIIRISRSDKENRMEYAAEYVLVPKWAVRHAVELLSDFLQNVDGCNHKVGICFCADHASLYTLRLAQEDEAALEQHRSSLKNN